MAIESRYVTSSVTVLYDREPANCHHHPRTYYGAPASTLPLHGIPEQMASGIGALAMFVPNVCICINYLGSKCPVRAILGLVSFRVHSSDSYWY